MFTPDIKKEIAEEIQTILQKLNHAELPKGEIQFLLHIDGAENWSWANIKNNSAKTTIIPYELIGNLSEERR